MLRTQSFLKLGQRSRQGYSDPKMVCDTPPSQDAYTHQIWISYHKEYKRYAPDRIILKTRSEDSHSDRKMVCDTPSSQDAF